MDIFILYKPKDKKNNLNFGDQLYELIYKKEYSYHPYKLPDSSNLTLVLLYIDAYEEIKNKPINNSLKYIDFKEEIFTLKVDLFYNDNADILRCYEKTVEYVKNEVDKYPQIKPVILFLKRYIKNMQMKKVHKGGISSYSIFLLVLNAVKSLELYMEIRNIGISQLLFYVLHKFSVFDFQYYGIGKDNYDYKLKSENLEENLYILDPISYFFNTFTHCFRRGYYLFNKSPLNSINAIFNSKVNFKG